MASGPVTSSWLWDGYNLTMTEAVGGGRAPDLEQVLAERLAEAEQLFQDFKELTPYRFTPFVRTFDSFAAYERWKRAQDNPWYR